MGRKRTVSKGMPDRVYLCKETYYYKTRRNKWLPLGTQEQQARSLGEWLFDQDYSVPDDLPETVAFDLYRRARASAQERGIRFELAFGHIHRLFQRAKGRCEVTGIHFSMEKPDGASFRPWAPSIDRINSAEGYHIDNCRLVCAYANMAMNQLGPVGLMQLAMAMQLRSCWQNQREFLEAKPIFLEETKEPISQTSV
jgi:hypothetical protein